MESPEHVIVARRVEAAKTVIVTSQASLRISTITPLSLKPFSAFAFPTISVVPVLPSPVVVAIIITMLCQRGSAATQDQRHHKGQRQTKRDDIFLQFLQHHYSLFLKAIRLRVSPVT